MKKAPDLSNSLTAARDLLGWKLASKSPDGLVVSGYIVETEAYDMHDPASHAFGGLRKRNASMYEEAGTIYVYFTYGMHYCMNIVTGEKGHGQGVLIRALEPLEGLNIMRKRRKVQSEHQLTNGPAKLAQALGINLSHGGVKLGQGELYLEPGIEVTEVVQTTRVGISRAVEQPWRFYVADNSYVSKK